MRRLPTAMLCGATSALYFGLLRQRILRWGATKAEATGTLPGDELLEHPDGEATRAIEIDAPAAAVWPWLAQMGPSPRGGAYTYDWIENLLGLHMHSAEEVLLEYQKPEVGETIGYGSNVMRLERVEGNRTLCWRSEDGSWVWSFVLSEQDGHTRLISRNRFALRTLPTRLAMLPMEPASLVMERKMLIGIKRRSERLAASPHWQDRLEVGEDGGESGASGAGEERGAGANGGVGANVLVCYSTKQGSTRGVAERIASRLQAHDMRAELSRCEDVQTLDGYDAVVIGSPVLNQRWLEGAEELVQREQQGLASRPLWLFSVGTFGDSKPLMGSLVRREPKGIDALRKATHARDYRVFAGVIEKDMWPRGSRIFYEALGGRFGDNRQWREIDAWADEIAGALRRVTA